MTQTLTARESDRQDLSAYITDPADVELLLQIKYDMSPTDFEHRVARYYAQVEGYHTIVQGGFDDEGVDIIATKDGSPTLYIQCKKWIKGHITIKEIGYFYGIVTDQTDDTIQMVYVTTTRVTPNAKKFAKNKQIIIKHYRDIIQMAHALGFEVSQTQTHVDADPDDVSIDTTALVDRQGPQIDRLTRELDSLRQIATREHIALDTLQQSLYLFQIDYNAIIAPYYLKKLEIDLQIVSLRSQSHHYDDLLADTDYEPADIDTRTYQQTKDYYDGQQKKQSDIHHKSEALSEAEHSDLKALYRKLMMQFHPDRFATDPDLLPLATQIAQAINEAYRNFDLQGLLAIQAKYHQGIQDGGDISLPKYDLQTLIQHRDALEKQILSTQKQINKLHNTELYLMYQKYHQYHDEGKDFFQDLIDQIQEEIIIAKDVLHSLQAQNTNDECPF